MKYTIAKNATVLYIATVKADSEAEALELAEELEDYEWEEMNGCNEEYEIAEVEET